MCRRLLTGLAVLAISLGLTTPANAGGWAVVHLDEEPTGVTAATPWRFGFMVLQHDVTPNSDVTPRVLATHLLSGETVTATGVQEGPVGHFVAEITLPQSGEWSWSIEPQPFAETTLATLTVHPSSPLRSWPAAAVVRQLAAVRQHG